MALDSSARSSVAVKVFHVQRYLNTGSRRITLKKGAMQCGGGSELQKRTENPERRNIGQNFRTGEARISHIRSEIKIYTYEPN